MPRSSRQPRGRHSFLHPQQIRRDPDDLRQPRDSAPRTDLRPRHLMKRILLCFLSVLLIAPALPAQTAPDAAELTKLLNDFLAGASKNDIAMHDRFWADELVYTSALGRRKGKADIMRELG